MSHRIPALEQGDQALAEWEAWNSMVTTHLERQHNPTMHALKNTIGSSSGGGGGGGTRSSSANNNEHPMPHWLSYTKSSSSKMLHGESQSTPQSRAELFRAATGPNSLEELKQSVSPDRRRLGSHGRLVPPNASESSPHSTDALHHTQGTITLPGVPHLDLLYQDLAPLSIGHYRAETMKASAASSPSSHEQQLLPEETGENGGKPLLASNTTINSANATPRSGRSVDPHRLQRLLLERQERQRMQLHETEQRQESQDRVDSGNYSPRRPTLDDIAYGGEELPVEAGIAIEGDEGKAAHSTQVVSTDVVAPLVESVLELPPVEDDILSSLDSSSDDVDPVSLDEEGDANDKGTAGNGGVTSSASMHAVSSQGVSSQTGNASKKKTAVEQLPYRKRKELIDKVRSRQSESYRSPTSPATAQISCGGDLSDEQVHSNGASEQWHSVTVHDSQQSQADAEISKDESTSASKRPIREKKGNSKGRKPQVTVTAPVGVSQSSVDISDPQLRSHVDDEVNAELKMTEAVEQPDNACKEEKDRLHPCDNCELNVVMDVPCSVDTDRCSAGPEGGVEEEDCHLQQQDERELAAVHNTDESSSGENDDDCYARTDSDDVGEDEQNSCVVLVDKIPMNSPPPASQSSHSVAELCGELQLPHSQATSKMDSDQKQQQHLSPLPHPSSVTAPVSATPSGSSKSIIRPQRRVFENVETVDSGSGSDSASSLSSVSSSDAEDVTGAVPDAATHGESSGQQVAHASVLPLETGKISTVASRSGSGTSSDSDEDLHAVVQQVIQSKKSLHNDPLFGPMMTSPKHEHVDHHHSRHHEATHHANSTRIREGELTSIVSAVMTSSSSVSEVMQVAQEQADTAEKQQLHFQIASLTNTVVEVQQELESRQLDCARLEEHQSLLLKAIERHCRFAEIADDECVLRLETTTHEQKEWDDIVDALHMAQVEEECARVTRHLKDEAAAKEAALKDEAAAREAALKDEAAARDAAFEDERDELLDRIDKLKQEVEAAHMLREEHSAACEEAFALERANLAEVHLHVMESHKREHQNVLEEAVCSARSELDESKREWSERFEKMLMDNSETVTDMQRRHDETLQATIARHNDVRRAIQAHAVESIVRARDLNTVQESTALRRHYLSLWQEVIRERRHTKVISSLHELHSLNLQQKQDAFEKKLIEQDEEYEKLRLDREQLLVECESLIATLESTRSSLASLENSEQQLRREHAERCSELERERQVTNQLTSRVAMLEELLLKAEDITMAQRSELFTQQAEIREARMTITKQARRQNRTLLQRQGLAEINQKRVQGLALLRVFAQWRDHVCRKLVSAGKVARQQNIEAREELRRWREHLLAAGSPRRSNTLHLPESSKHQSSNNSRAGSTASLKQSGTQHSDESLPITTAEALLMEDDIAVALKYLLTRERAELSAAKGSLAKHRQMLIDGNDAMEKMLLEMEILTKQNTELVSLYEARGGSVPRSLRCAEVSRLAELVRAEADAADSRDSTSRPPSAAQQQRPAAVSRSRKYERDSDADGSYEIQ